MSVYVTGDKHGSFKEYDKIKKFCKENNTTTDDFMIILGDAGINYYCDVRDNILKEKLANIPITFLCIHGNHEERPYNLPQYRRANIHGGRCFIEPEYPNIVFLDDGEEYTIDRKKYLVLGGAYSVDKHYRLMTGNKWFINEQTDIKTRNSIMNIVKDKSYDYVLSHTCPIEWEPTDLFLPDLDQSTVDASQELWLSDIKKVIKYKQWLFGHFHGDRQSAPWSQENYRMFYHDITKII